MTTRRMRGWMLLLMGVVLSASAAVAAEPAPERVHQESEHFTIDSNLPPGFPEAILNLCETDLAGYKELFGLDVIPPGDTRKIHVFADFKPNSGALWVELKSPMEIHLLAGSDKALNPPGQGGPHNVFGFAHEMGHLVMMFDDSAFDQGFADYFGSEVVDYLQPRLGDKAWPRPYDYVVIEGTPRMRSWVGKAEAGSEEAAAVLLYEIEQKHGRKVIGDAVEQVAASSDFTIKSESGSDYKAYQVESFCQVLAKLTGDTGIEALFAERGFGRRPEVEQESILAARLWSFPDNKSLDEFLIGKWGDNVEGIVDGENVTMLARFPAGRGWPVKLPTGVTLDAEGGPLSVWYQPATKRAYILGRARVSVTGAIVENDAIGADGQPLHLNPNAPSSPVPATQPAAPQPAPAASPDAEPQNVPSAKLWSFPDKGSLDRFLISRWGGNVEGVIDGQPVTLIRFPEGSTRLPWGLVVEAAGGDSLSIWYQPATKRAYIFGRARVPSTGIVVENDAIGPDGQPLHLNTGGSSAAPSAATPASPAPAGNQSAPPATGRVESAHFVIKSYLPRPFPQAILDLCEASLDGYRELFGLDLSPKAGERKLRIFADMDASVRGGLWVRPERVPAEIHYVLAEDRQLNPPGQGGAHHVFGFAHEFGHFAAMFDDPQFGQGFADYLGSEVVDYLQPRLGDKAWPRPYDYVKLDGMARLKTWQSEAKPERGNAVAVVLYEITQKHGRKVIGEAVTRLAASAKPVVVRGDFGEDHLAYRVGDFCRALVEVTGDKSIEMLFAQKIPAAPRVRNITSQELWACRTEEARTKLMEERWGGDGFFTPGLLDGKEVRAFFTGGSPEETGSCHVANGMAIELLGGAWQYGYFQPSTGRSYLVGRFRVLPAGTVVQDDAVDAEGKPLHLNPSAPPAVPVKEVARTESAHFVLETNLPDSPTKAILSTSEAALGGYQTLFGLDLRPKRAGRKIQLCLLGFEDAHYMGLMVRAEPVPVIAFTEQPSDRTSTAWLQYAYTRGLGELAASFDNDDFQQGFTDYMTAEVMGYLQQRLGEDAWPGAGDRREVRRVVVSRGKFLATKSGGDGTDKDAAALLARIAQQHGTTAIGAAIRRLRQSTPSIAPPPGVARKYHVDDLRRALVEVTGDSGITALFEEAGF